MTPKIHFLDFWANLENNPLEQFSPSLGALTINHDFIFLRIEGLIEQSLTRKIIKTRAGHF